MKGWEESRSPGRKRQKKCDNFFCCSRTVSPISKAPKIQIRQIRWFEIGLWSLAGADFETGATERALKTKKDAKILDASG